MKDDNPFLEVYYFQPLCLPEVFGGVSCPPLPASRAFKAQLVPDFL
jgi:hypothetical protein